MKKITLLLLGFVLGVSTLSAQDILLTWEGEPLEETIYVFGSQFDAEIVAHAVVTNNTDESMDIKVRRDQLEMQEGTMSQFCWGLCYPPNTIHWGLVNLHLMNISPDITCLWVSGVPQRLSMSSST